MIKGKTYTEKNVRRGTKMEKYDVVIIGAGPAGIFSALELHKRNPNFKVLLLEKGRSLDKRDCPKRHGQDCKKCKLCAITSGFSGAGAYSDGKLNLTCESGGWLKEYISQKECGDLLQYIDGIYMKFGAPQVINQCDSARVQEIKYEAHKHNIMLVPFPIRHLGTEGSFQIYQNMYEYLANQTRTDISCNTQVKNIIIKKQKIVGVELDNGKQINANYIIAAPGREGSEWLANQAGVLGIPTENNAVDIGVRVEVPNCVIDHLTKHLYESKFIYYGDTFENRVRTFCMNPGGYVSTEFYDGGSIATVNGHSYANPELKTDNTNFALLVSTKFTYPFTEPITYGKYIARLANMLTGGGVLVQRLGDLLKGRRTDAPRLAKSTTIPTLLDAVPGDLSFALPHRHLLSIVETIKALDYMAPGIYSKNTLLYGMEVKFYSSKIKVNKKLQTPIEGLYAIGDGAGITRGLMQSSMSGVIAARSIIDNH